MQEGISMTQTERRRFLIQELLKEEPNYREMEIPASEQEQKRLLRALMNIRMPAPVDKAFLDIQDAYLQEAIIQKGITDAAALAPVGRNLFIWQGDITTLRCDAIVNAANSQMLGCFHPCHGCIDNAIHTYAGVQLRLACDELMQRQGYEEPVGKAKITPAYNLPCRYVLHTVGPMVRGRLTEEDCEALASCYRSCLALAREKKIESIAFCCISTGEFRFPNEEAARIALSTVKAFQESTGSEMKIIFNVFKDADLRIYHRLLTHITRDEKKE